MATEALQPFDPRRNFTVACTMNPGTARTFKVGDFVIFNDEAKSPDVGYLRSYECAQILCEGDTLASDILAVASPDPGSDLTVCDSDVTRCYRC